MLMGIGVRSIAGMGAVSSPVQAERLRMAAITVVRSMDRFI